MEKQNQEKQEQLNYRTIGYESNKGNEGIYYSDDIEYSEEIKGVVYINGVKYISYKSIEDKLIELWYGKNDIKSIPKEQKNQMIKYLRIKVVDTSEKDFMTIRSFMEGLG